MPKTKSSSMIPTVDPERFMPFARGVFARWPELSEVRGPVEVDKILSPLLAHAQWSHAEGLAASSRVFALLGWLSFRQLDAPDAFASDELLTAAARATLRSRNPGKAPWPELEQALEELEKRESVPPVDPQQFASEFLLMSGAIMAMNAGQVEKAAAHQIISGRWSTEADASAALKRTLALLKAAGKFDPDSTSQTVARQTGLLELAARLPLSREEVDADWPAMLHALQQSDLKNTPPERPVPIKVLPDGTGAMAVGIRAELQYHLSPAEIEASENWLWLATLERLPGYSALSHIDGRHGLNFLTILRAEGNDSTPLFSLIYPARQTALEALRLIEEDVRDDDRSALAPEIQSLLGEDGTVLPVNVVAACGMADRWLNDSALAGRSEQVKAVWLASALHRLNAYLYNVTALGFESGRPDRALSGKEIDRCVDTVLARVAALSDESVRQDRTQAIDLLYLSSISRSLTRATDLTRVILALAERLASQPPVQWSLLKLSVVNDVGLPLIGSRAALNWRISSRPLVRGDRLEDVDALAGELWLQYAELIRGQIPGEVFTVLMADGLPLSPASRPLSSAEQVESTPSSDQYQRIDAELRRRAASQATYAPSGAFQIMLPIELRSLLPDIYKLTGVIVRERGLEAIWVRGYNLKDQHHREFTRKPSFIICWRPEQPIKTALLPSDQATALHLVISAIYHDLVVAGEPAFPRNEAEKLLIGHAPALDQPRPVKSGRKKQRSKTLSAPFSMPRFALTGLRSWASGEERQYVRRRAHHVAGHRRVLPDGHQPRPTAQEEAWLDNIVLADGETYISPHERGLSGIDPDTAESIVPRPIVARGLAVLITSFCRDME